MQDALRYSMVCNNIIDDDLKSFLMKCYSDYSNNICGLIEEIKRIEIKGTTQKYQNLLFKFTVKFIGALWIFQNVTLFLKQLLQKKT